MQPERAPAEIVELARARARARAIREWDAADRLREEIELAGWRIVDRGTDFSLHVAHPPDTCVDGVLRYGWSGSVPSRLDEPALGRATVIVATNGEARDLEQTLASVRGLDGANVVVVADAPTTAEEDLIAAVAEGGAGDAGEADEAGEAVGARADGAAANTDRAAGVDEVLRTSARLGVGAARNAGLRRASAPIAVLVEAGAELSDGLLEALVAALDDPTVAIAGDRGVQSGDLRRFTDGAAGDVAALAGRVIAFRRDDFTARGPLDERFATTSALDTWWSLVLREPARDEPPRRAVALDGPPPNETAAGREGSWQHAHQVRSGGELDRAARRDRYRIIDRFGGRRELAVQRDGQPEKGARSAAR